MLAMISTAVSGNDPFAVSPESMTASVPSNTALATSVISARVGSGFVIIDSSICVAVTTNFPAMLHFVISHFCARATFSDGISIPRSPRATMMPSVSRMISSMFARPASFSILEMIFTFCPPASSSVLRMNRTSSPLCTNDAAMKSILCLAQKFWTSLISCGVSTGMSTSTPGKLQFFLSPSSLVLRTLPLRVVPFRISLTSMTIVPSAIRIRFPGSTLWHSLSYEIPIRVSSSVLYPSKVVYASPTASTMMS
mmetsp:Transcript_67918/g.162591  ORF Transcript_67918/g.162591 Transcript_67918/m.162591 type:complete len:253 (-) Transcript_67918:45-803(-)